MLSLLARAQREGLINWYFKCLLDQRGRQADRVQPQLFVSVLGAAESQPALADDRLYSLPQYRIGSRALAGVRWQRNTRDFDKF